MDQVHRVLRNPSEQKENQLFKLIKTNDYTSLTSMARMKRDCPHEVFDPS